MRCRATVALILVTLIVGSTVAAFGDATVVWIPRLEEAGRLLVEMRPALELLGWQVQWTPEEERVDATRAGLTMTMWMDEPEVLVNGESVMLDVPPRLMWNRTFVPLRFVAETVGAQVEYQGDRVLVVGPMGDLLFRFMD
ncbi:MAG: copper amine oxidase N-terminal domain-containing protein [Armatimonadetes bacterium]|nr:copper amine oxidase N-terminal domain-containing protein [Armatimonadota bacterium]